MRSFSIISPEEIFNSYNKYGEDFLVIDINNYKESTMKTVKYFDIKIKTEDGSLIIPKIRFAKLLLAMMFSAILIASSKFRLFWPL
jgi:hypothetical protein